MSGPSVVRAALLSVAALGFVIGLATAVHAQAAIDPKALVGEWNGSWVDRRDARTNGQYSLTIERVDGNKVYGFGTLYIRRSFDFKFAGTFDGSRLTFGTETKVDLLVEGTNMRGDLRRAHRSAHHHVEQTQVAARANFKEIRTMAPSVGFIGVGNMGNPMAGNILKNGFPMTVFDKSAEDDGEPRPGRRERRVVGAGGRRGAREVVADVACRRRPDVEKRSISSRRPHRAARSRAPCSIDLSSVLPSTPRKLEPRCKARGVHFLEAPVSGGVTRRERGDARGHGRRRRGVLERVRPILRAIGPNIYHVGPVGAGNTVKAINNMMASVNALAMMEGLIVGLKAGLDPMIVYEVVKASSGNSNALARVRRALIPRNFEPGFKVALMNKDLETFNTIAKELHVPVSFANVAQRYQQAALAAGLGEKDTSVILTVIERLAALTPRAGA